MGDVIGDINGRRGQINEISDRNGLKSIESMVPLANMFQYVSTLRSSTKGRANYSMQLAKYDFVPQNVEKELLAKFSSSVVVEEE
ncbi:unnamed protein product [Choristocarpus tenellus]